MKQALPQHSDDDHPQRRLRHSGAVSPGRREVLLVNGGHWFARGEIVYLNDTFRLPHTELVE